MKCRFKRIGDQIVVLVGLTTRELVLMFRILVLWQVGRRPHPECLSRALFNPSEIRKEGKRSPFPMSAERGDSLGDLA